MLQVKGVSCGWCKDRSPKAPGVLNGEATDLETLLKVIISKASTYPTSEKKRFNERPA